MKIINIFCIFIILTLLISSFYIESITLGELWASFHVISLIGFQKIIENLFLSININYDIWHKILLPILNLKFLFLLILLQSIIFIYILKK